MCHVLLGNAKLYRHLLRIDRDLAAAERAAGCAACGRLDAADYPRKPRGGPAVLPEGYALRFSFCCDACRRGRRHRRSASLVVACTWRR